MVRKIIYWTSTIIVMGMMGMSAFMYLSQNPQVIEGFKSMGYPPYFHWILGTAKLLGIFGVIQWKCKSLQEWAYAGYTFTFIGATWTHIATGTAFLSPIIAFAILMVSYLTRAKIQSTK